MPDRTDRASFVVLLLLCALPWSVQTFSNGGTTFVFGWGLFNTAPPNATYIWDFFFLYTRGLPGYIYAWPVSVCCYVGAVVSGLVGLVTGREDPRVTGGLLVVAGVAQLSLARGFSVQPYRTAWPLGTFAFLVVAWWLYWPAAKRRFQQVWS
ncbi:TIGR04206 family protein [Salinigranum sp.]|uniref:TIGR04206 family protein n=1 Tax=Salinigranum sp. TaxID=1966351 RepID=UPI0035659207